MEDLEKTHQYIDKHFEEDLEKIRNYLRQPSICFTGQGMREGAELTLRFLKELEPEEAHLVSPPPPSEEYPGGGYSVVYAKVKSKNPRAKTLFIYGMYDMMPVYPEWGGKWTFPPFAAEIVDGTEIGLPPQIGKVMVARGAQNSKAPLLALINAVRSMQEATGDIPVNLLFGIEGEEERGSHPSYSKFVKEYLNEIKKCDAMFLHMMRQEIEAIGPKTFPIPPRIQLGVRGVCGMTLEIKGGEWGGPMERDISSTNCNWVDIPAWRLIKALNTMVGDEGEVLIEGLYDNVRPPSSAEKEMFERLKEHLDENRMREILGICRFRGGLSGRNLFEKYWWYPTFNLSGLWSGPSSPPFTVLPHKANAHIEVRFPPNMTVDEIVSKVRKHLDKHGFAEIAITSVGAAEPCDTSDVNEPVVQAAIRASKKMGLQYLLTPTEKAGCGAIGELYKHARLPFVDTGMGYGGRMHQVDEWISVEGIAPCEKYAATFLYEYSKTELGYCGASSPAISKYSCNSYKNNKRC